jgi:hypothetical protein
MWLWYTVEDLLVQLEMCRAWDYAGDPFIGSIMQDIERLAGPSSDEAAGVRAEIARMFPPRKARDPDADDDSDMLVATLYSLAPDLTAGWVDTVLGGRKLRDVPNAELQQIIDRLKAAAEIDRAVDEKVVA